MDVELELVECSEVIRNQLLLFYNLSYYIEQNNRS